MNDLLMPVQTQAGFFGHRELVRRIFSRIGAGRPQSIAVIGSRKSGKTSLLNYLADHAVREQYLETDSQYQFFKISADDYTGSGAGEFIGKVLKRITDKAILERNYYNYFLEYVEALHESGRKLIVLFDDFHRITTDDKFPLEFFSFLRSLANNYNVAYITTSFLELQKLCVVKVIEDSPFFNIFTNLALGFLTGGDAAALYSSLAGTEEGAAAVTAWLGGSPYLIKLVMEKILGLKEAGKLKSINPEKELLPIAAAYFEKIISILPAEAAKPLKAVAKGKNPDPKEIYMLRPLVKHGFLKEDEAESLTCFSPALLCYLKQYFSPALLKGIKDYG